MTTITLNKNGFTGVFDALEYFGLIDIDSNGDAKGKEGLSEAPRWCGRWDGYYWSNSCIGLTENGIKKLQEIALIENDAVSEWLINAD